MNLLNVFKKKILKNDNEVINSLKNKDVEKINKIKQDTEILKAVENAKKAYYETETNIKICQMEQDKRKMMQDAEILQYENNNIDLKCKQAKQQRKLSYFNIKNKVLKEEMTKFEDMGEKQKKESKTCSIASGCTTCIGLIMYLHPTKLLSLTMLMLIATLSLTIFVAYLSNSFLQYISAYIQKFIDNENKNKLRQQFQKNAIILSLVIIILYTSYSIWTNYILWSRVGIGKIGAILFSCILDFMAIALSIISPDFTTLSINKAYENEVIGEEEKTGISNSQNTNVEQAKTEDKKQVIKTGQTAKNGENNPIEKIVKKQAKTEDEKQVKTLVKKPSVRRTSASKITFKNMQDTINGLPDGTIIKPKLVQMTGNSNYKTWIKKCQNVERDENNNYVKKSNVIPLERQG